MNAKVNHSIPPLPDAYSRVTNPERFAPLHDAAAETLEKLVADFDVEVIETAGESSKTGGLGPSTIRSVTLRPRDPGAAELTVSFTSFPGLSARFGVAVSAAFPACGCDACAETAEGEMQRFRLMVQSVVSGRFRERIHGLLRKHFEYEMWSPEHAERSSSVLSRNDPRYSLRRESHRWQPWRPRIPKQQ